MASLVRDLWPLLCRLLLLGAVIGLLPLLPSLVLSGKSRPYLVVVVPCLVVFSLVSVAWRVRWMFRLAARTRRFLTAPGGRVVLRYAPELHPQADAREVVALAEKTLAQLEGVFGRLTPFWQGSLMAPLLFRRRLYVYLFPTGPSVEETFGKNHWGAALSLVHAIVVPFAGVQLEEVLRHELTHHFTARWNPWAPPLLSEGLATWLQGTHGGYVIDELAAASLRQGTYRLHSLLDSTDFFAASCGYTLAASFSGFLISRFGLVPYRQFYCGQRGEAGFDTRFAKQFGLTLEEAEWQWRSELLEKFKSPPAVEWWVCRFA
jgi:hypothetical protein